MAIGGIVSMTGIPSSTKIGVVCGFGGTLKALARSAAEELPWRFWL
jgi:hypothetical protein